MTPKASDSYFTDRPILDAMLELWPGGADLDPCTEVGCFVAAKQTYDIRRGQDGRVLPWEGRVFCNPPFSDIASFAAKAAAHAIDGGQCLLVVPVSSDTRWFQSMVLPHGVVCLLNGRHKFWKKGASKPTPSMTSVCVVYFGEHAAEFCRVFGRLGTIVKRYEPPKPKRQRRAA